VAELAARQGIGEADVVWDLTGRILPAPRAPRPARKGVRARRAKPPA
jgi:hypothetical protein